LFPAAVIFPTTGAQKIIITPFTHYTYRYLLQQQRRDPGARVLVVSGDGGGIQRRTISSAKTPRQLLPAFDRSPATNQIRQHGRRQPVPPRVHIQIYIFYVIILYRHTHTHTYILLIIASLCSHKHTDVRALARTLARIYGTNFHRRSRRHTHATLACKICLTRP